MKEHVAGVMKLGRIYQYYIFQTDWLEHTGTTKIRKQKY